MPDAPAASTSLDRRTMLEQLVGGAVAVAMTPAVSAATTIADLPRRAVEMRAQEADLSWTTRLTGAHKAVYDSPDIAGGLGVFRAAVVASQYQVHLKLPPSAISNVIVLRHDGIMLAMNARFWERYRIAERFGVKHPWSGEPVTRNPVFLTPADGLPPLLAGATLPEQIARGTIVLACALAFSDVVDIIVKADSVAEGAARATAQSMLIPGILMQPSGVFATTLAQERGCVYVRAT